MLWNGKSNEITNVNLPFQIIEQVDANDMETHGKYFKHFIFSDVKEEGYGAKILASAFVANGYKNLIGAQNVANQKALKLTLMGTLRFARPTSCGIVSLLFKNGF